MGAMAVRLLTESRLITSTRWSHRSTIFDRSKLVENLPQWIHIREVTTLRRRCEYRAGIREQAADTHGKTLNTNRCLEELAQSLVLPSNFLASLPADLRLDVNDAAFALSNGPLKEKCGEKVSEVLMQLSQALEKADTQSVATLAKNVPSLQSALQHGPSSQADLSKRFIGAGRYLSTTGQFGEGELQRLAQALIAAGEALSVGIDVDVNQPVVDQGRVLKFGSLQVEVTSRQAYLGAAIAFVFGVLSWQLTASLQNISDSSVQYSNDSILLATSLRGTLLIAGYSFTGLSAISMVALLIIGSKLSATGK